MKKNNKAVGENENITVENNDIEEVKNEEETISDEVIEEDAEKASIIGEVKKFTSSDYYRETVENFKAVTANKYHTKHWSHKFTSLIVKDIADTLDITDKYSSISMDVFNHIFINDLYHNIQYLDLEFILLYVYEKEQFDELKEQMNITDESLNAQLDRIKYGLEDIITETIGNFMIGSRVQEMLSNQSYFGTFRLNTEYQIRILVENGISSIVDIADYAYLLSEEYLDYCVDILTEKLDKCILDDDLRQIYLNAIYTLITKYNNGDNTLSQEFLKKHKETISMVSFSLLNRHKKFDDITKVQK